MKAARYSLWDEEGRPGQRRSNREEEEEEEKEQ